VFRELLLKRVSGFCTLSPTQFDELERHYELMLKWNKVINLTRIEGVEEAVDRHYAESLFLGANLPGGGITIADVGSGAGFPGFPVAVLRPECAVTLIESHQRKAVFLKEACRSVANVSVTSKRAEEVAGRFDWVVSRAVSWEEIEKVAFGLAACVGLLGAAPVGVSRDFAIRSVTVPWDENRKLTIVSRETSPLGST
jgi:16S rRNA (guanine(527)-N(7))-methyltransferase RsmG